MLYALGRWASRAKYLVLAIWLVILALLGAGALFLAQGANAPITIPGTESQAAIDSLERTFPQVSGASGTIIVVAPEGELVTDEPFASEITAAAADLEALEFMSGVSHPFAEEAPTGLNDTSQAAMITVQFEGTTGQIPASIEQGVQDVTAQLQEVLPEGTQVSYGGSAFSAAIPHISIAEAIGVVVAFIVLIFTLGSLIAAGMPLIIALIGVGISVAGIYFSTAFLDMTSTTPMLALMLGLAVGIDYTLFIVSRHQEQVRDGLPINESIARATATSGSAVVFAGLTVIIALLGLAVAGIPFLTALGVAAAAGVAVAVLIAVTLTPAILAMAGPKILSRKQRKALVAKRVPVETEHSATGNMTAQGSQHQKTSRADRFFGGWVRLVTVKPIVTILVVLIGLGAAAIPMFSLKLALPGAETLEPENPARITYELTGEYFGDGANGPLLLTGSIIGSTDPLGLMEDLADEVRAIPGVADVPLATPNMGADTGIIQVVPEEGPQADSTAELVKELRAHHDEWKETYGVSLAVTGFTAVGIDVSNLLFEALLPFALLVVGLSLILLAMVFRSVWVPIKATLGYLLSVGASFGAVVAVFQWGWFGDLLNVHSTGPVLSFMPIILMGVLFGLAMDYEVFLVSRIREEVVHGADSSTAIRRGFVGSGRVVTAAAIIMFAVFAAFIPGGDPSIKVISLGLAVGVFVDAFIVRMTLVPAVLELLGDRAWRMPKWLDKALPVFDVEGEGLAREIAHANWPADAPDSRIALEGALLGNGSTLQQLRVASGEALLLDPAAASSVPLAELLTGRAPLELGTAKITGLLLPERAGSLRARTAWANPGSLAETLEDNPAVLVLDLRRWGAASGVSGAAEQLAETKRLLAAREAIGGKGSTKDTVLIVLGTPDLAAAALPPEARIVTPEWPQGAPSAHTNASTSTATHAVEVETTGAAR